MIEIQIPAWLFYVDIALVGIGSLTLGRWTGYVINKFVLKGQSEVEDED